MNLTDILFLYSGGIGNYDPDMSIGGAASSSEIVSNVLENLFNEVSLNEREAGLVDYRCFYILNNHATDSLLLTALFIQSNTESPDTTVELGLGPAGVNGEAQVIADRLTAPVGVTFLDYPSSGSGLSIGTLLAGDFVSVWVRRTVSALASTPAEDPFTLRLTGVPVTEAVSPSSP